MFVIVDDREIVKSGYASSFDREGVASAGLGADEFEEWVSGVGKRDLQAVEAFLIGDCTKRDVFPKLIRERCHVPVIALNDSPSLEQTLELFAAGMDDVVRKPIHVREIMARVGAIRRRRQAKRKRNSRTWARCASILTAAIPRLRARRCRCRAANAGFSNIW